LPLWVTPTPPSPPRRGRVGVGGKTSPAVKSYSLNKKLFSDIPGVVIFYLQYEPIYGG
jgi:hypothetical protein